MKKIIMVLAIISALLLLVACSTKVPSTQQNQQLNHEQQNSDLQEIDNSLADLNKIDQEFNTTDLDNLDKDLDLGLE